MTQGEIPLPGGNVTQGLVRVGDTVWRPQTAHTSTTNALLDHFATNGISFTPRPLGVDSQDRTILSYLPGSTDFPADLWTADTTLIQAAKMLRQLHDASTTFQPTTPIWAYAYPDASQHEVICHNDFAPYNLVFQNGVPTGVIDWDLAGPGPRLRDLAYLAYWLVPLSFGKTDMRAASEADITNGHRRLHALCDSYGTADIQGLLSMVGHVLRHMGSRDAAQAMIGPDAALRLEVGGHFAHWRAEQAAFIAKRPCFRI